MLFLYLSHVLKFRVANHPYRIILDMWGKLRGFAREIFPTFTDVKHAVRDVVFIIGVFHVGTNYGVNLTYCVGPSMLPTIPEKGNMVLIDTFNYRVMKKKYKVGDVVICSCPYEAEKSVCKRVAATAGDSVYMRSRSYGVPAKVTKTINSNLSGMIKDINGNRVLETKQDNEDTRHMLEVVIPPGHVWLAGDNNVNSTDSRTYGPVPVALLKGRAFTKMSLLYIGDDIVGNDDGTTGSTNMATASEAREGEKEQRGEDNNSVTRKRTKKSWSPFRDVPSLEVDHSHALHGIIVKRATKG